MSTGQAGAVCTPGRGGSVLRVMAGWRQACFGPFLHSPTHLCIPKAYIKDITHSRHTGLSAVGKGLQLAWQKVLDKLFIANTIPGTEQEIHVFQDAFTCICSFQYSNIWDVGSSFHVRDGETEAARHSMTCLSTQGRDVAAPSAGRGLLRLASVSSPHSSLVLSGWPSLYPQRPPYRACGRWALNLGLPDPRAQVPSTLPHLISSLKPSWQTLPLAAQPWRPRLLHLRDGRFLPGGRGAGIMQAGNLNSSGKTHQHFPLCHYYTLQPQRNWPLSGISSLLQLFPICNWFCGTQREGGWGVDEVLPPLSFFPFFSLF